MKELLYLLGLFLLILLGWDYPIFQPLKLLVVFFHESSHALATLLTGGTVKDLMIVKEQGGQVISAGGNRFIILSAGYLGSLAWGVGIYLASVKTKHDKKIMALLGLTIAVLTLLFTHTLFSWVFGALTSCLMLLSAKFLSTFYNDFLLRLLGLTNMAYVPLDIYSDTILHAQLRSDAFMLATEFGGTTVLWGGVWIVLSVLLIFFCLRWSVSRVN
ncbi:MAG: M50 family peptidase [Methylococcaceae bacterium]|jgi:hypothetical protein|nr:MAG: M50 family peptidase [Methylococcaceae bacterium]